MTAALAIRSGLPGTLRDNAYILPPDLSLDEWGRIARLADHIVAASPWWLCDVMAYGEAKFGQDHAQALPGPDEDPYGASESRMKQAAWMASVYPVGTRVPLASYTHHRIAADLPPTRRREMLHEVAQAEQEVRDGVEGAKRISTRELGRRVKVEQEREQGRAVAVDGAPIEPADDLEWRPSREDLTDEFRLMFEQRLAGIGKRHAVGFEAGWLAALVCADYLAAFKRDGA